MKRLPKTTEAEIRHYFHIWANAEGRCTACQGWTPVIGGCCDAFVDVDGELIKETEIVDEICECKDDTATLCYACQYHSDTWGLV